MDMQIQTAQDLTAATGIRETQALQFDIPRRIVILSRTCPLFRKLAGKRSEDGKLGSGLRQSPCSLRQSQMDTHQHAESAVERHEPARWHLGAHRTRIHGDGADQHDGKLNAGHQADRKRTVVFHAQHRRIPLRPCGERPLLRRSQADSPDILEQRRLPPPELCPKKRLAFFQAGLQSHRKEADR